MTKITINTDGVERVFTTEGFVSADHLKGMLQSVFGVVNEIVASVLAPGVVSEPELGAVKPKRKYTKKRK